MNKKLLLLFALMVIGATGHSQILISIILGDKLNSPDLEFGVDGGLNFSRITGLETNSVALDLHLGFYFDIRMKNQWWFNTGLLVKSSQGANNLTENDVLDLYPDFLAYVDSGKFSQSMGYFNVPMMVKYRFKNHIYVEGGVQAALLYKAKMNFKHEIDDLTVTSSWKNADLFNRIDFGAVLGFGYKLMQGEGMNVGFKYYIGMVDITKTTTYKNYNNVFYFKVDIPIGKKKAAAARIEKEKEK